MNSRQDKKNINVRILQIEFGTPEYCDSIALRTKILRVPLGLEFDTKSLSMEYDSIHIGCYSEKYELIGCLVLKMENNHSIKMRQVAIDNTVQGLGIGTAMVMDSESLVKELGINKITCHARESAVPFYLKLDYKIVGKKFIEVGIPHFKMEKNL